MTTKPHPHDFPTYSPAEHCADAVIHYVGVSASIIASIWLLIVGFTSSVTAVAVSLVVYCIGLMGMLGASALYNLTRPGKWKEILRRVDHAMIFIMIAGSYTPFALNSMWETGGELLLYMVWAVALLGLLLKVCFPRRFDRSGVLLYLVMGWMIVINAETLMTAVSPPVFWLLLVGGCLYSVGTIFHVLEQIPFHNAIWHAFVLIAAGTHFSAIAIEFTA